MLIIKSAGSTPTEKVLAHFGELSFLSLWSYPNPYTDEGKKNDGDGKELCDLLVLFGNHVLIFSDKSIEYKDTGRLEIDWRRWYKKAIHKSASQIYGAENWIKTYPDRIFLDSKCKNKFPLQFPNANNLIIHRIIVTPLSGESMKNLIGGSGTLSINSNVKDNEHYDNPFCVGHINSQKGYIHILNETSLEILMRELNTVNDFIEYLTKKEELMLSNQLVHVAGEEELLAIYQETIDENNNHAFIFEDTNIVISEGFWENHIKRPEYLLRHEADKISFLWDMSNEVQKLTYIFKDKLFI
ncbi:MAG: hypothetical protein EOM50_16765 [Erysipelotrichia bacterium]|nr:hypothetical protein [Erysipelotrichia bacterium]